MDTNNLTNQIPEEVLDTKKAFIQALKIRNKKIALFVLATAIWVFFCIKLIPSSTMGTDLVFYILGAPLIIWVIWLSSIYSEIRKAFWKQIASKYQWEYIPDKNIDNEKALLFDMGHTKLAQNDITGNYNNLPFNIFEYQYTVGSGKNSQTYYFTVFEIKFTGTFPHLYLNYKNDWYSNNPSMFSSFTNISLPSEFAAKFKLYAPKEYELETLEIFTPDIFALLLDSKWDHDMEFVDGELVIYSNSKFSNFTNLDEELNKIKKFVDILSPSLNKLKLTPIGNFKSSLE